jgi:hypothetical protein
LFFNFLLESFFSFFLPKVYDSKTLAIELAKRTRFLRNEVVAEELKEEESEGRGFVLGFYEAFRQFLIRGLSKEDFADLYSRTITYGVFAARTRSKNGHWFSSIGEKDSNLSIIPVKTISYVSCSSFPQGTATY